MPAPVGQVLALGYRSGEAWNETAFSNPDFDAKLKQALSLNPKFDGAAEAQKTLGSL